MHLHVYVRNPYDNARHQFTLIASCARGCVLYLCGSTKWTIESIDRRTAMCRDVGVDVRRSSYRTLNMLVRYHRYSLVLAWQHFPVVSCRLDPYGPVATFLVSQTRHTSPDAGPMISLAAVVSRVADSTAFSQCVVHVPVLGLASLAAAMVQPQSCFARFYNVWKQARVLVEKPEASARSPMHRYHRCTRLATCHLHFRYMRKAGTL